MGVTRKQAENIASVLSEGMPYIQRFYGKIIVVKYGGAAMSDVSLKMGFARDIALMALQGDARGKWLPHNIIKYGFGALVIHIFEGDY